MELTLKQVGDSRLVRCHVRRLQTYSKPILLISSTAAAPHLLVFKQHALMFSHWYFLVCLCYICFRRRLKLNLS